MDLDVILKTVYHESLAKTGHLDRELRVVPNWNFTCDAYITSLLLGVRIRPDGESYPEVQTWRSSESGFDMVENRLIVLSPGNFSTDGVIRYHLTPPIPVAAGDMLGVYQPQHSQSVVQFYYIKDDADAPAAYKMDSHTHERMVKHEYILLSAITGSEIKMKCISVVRNIFLQIFHNAVVGFSHSKVLNRKCSMQNSTEVLKEKSS